MDKVNLTFAILNGLFSLANIGFYFVTGSLMSLGVGIFCFGAAATAAYMAIHSNRR